jgi:hypothetical protein
MDRPNGLSAWTVTVSTHLPTLSKPQATVLALWSYGIVFAHCCGLTTVAALLAGLLDRKEAAVRQQLREWCYEAKAKRGRKRHALDVTTCFADLLRWVLAWWDPSDRRLVLALDATTLGTRFTVLAIAVVYRSTAIPVAWAAHPLTVYVGGLLGGGAPGPVADRDRPGGGGGRSQLVWAAHLDRGAV